MRQEAPYNQWTNFLRDNLPTGWDQDWAETFAAALYTSEGPLGQFYY